MKKIEKLIEAANNLWLIKSEPTVFSIQDLINSKNKTTSWDGVRNYQARNLMRDMLLGDLAFFYHSNTKPPHIAGIAKVVKLAYPDHTSWDKKSKYFDPKSTKDNPRWFMVDVKWVSSFDKIVSLDDLKANKNLKDMKVVQKGSRLSVQPVTKKEFLEIIKMTSINSVAGL